MKRVRHLESAMVIVDHVLALMAAALMALATLGPARASPGPARTQPAGFVAVLIAGDGSLPVFDNAVADMAARLRDAGNTSIARLSASTTILAQRVARPATRGAVLAAIASMKPAPGQGCLVFATSHGVRHEGLYLSLHDEVLTPRALDRALVQGCGAAPTIVVVSSCFSGSFAASPMTRDTRIVLTAARPDRTSFGCQAGRDYTVFDACLLGALDHADTWSQAFGLTRVCVSAEERREGVTPSEPQGWFGKASEDSSFLKKRSKRLSPVLSRTQ